MIQKEDKAEADCRVWEATSGTGWLDRNSRGSKVLKKEGASAYYYEVEREPVAPGGGVVEVVAEEHEGLKRTKITTKIGLDKE